jgi:GTP cyclohydrolase I
MTTLAPPAKTWSDAATADDGFDEAIDDARLTATPRRHVDDVDWRRYEGYVAEIFSAFGLDLDTSSTSSTPTRFLRAMWDATDGYDGDPKLLTAFPTECHGASNCELAQVIEGPIPFFGLCEHHALPFMGQAYKLTRLVRVLTRRFGVQERMTHQIADELDRLMAPHGVAVYLEAHHLCTQMRGVREITAKTRTTAYRGVYAENADLRSEFFDASGLRATGAR